MENVKRKTVSWMLLFVLAALFSCAEKQGSLIGRWTVEKVSVDFDEHRATPETVKQYGELEKGNVIEITNDSVLTLITGGDTLTGRCALKGTRLTCDGQPFGLFEKGKIQTETGTPLGKIRVIYRRE